MPLLFGLYMGLGTWGAVEGGILGNLLPPDLVAVLNIPPFIGAVIVSGNGYAPNSLAFAVLAFLQWVVIATLVKSWLGHARGARATDVDP